MDLKSVRESQRDGLARARPLGLCGPSSCDAGQTPFAVSRTAQADWRVVAAVCDSRLSLLSDWMKSLKNSFSKTLREMNVPAPHWQKGFFDHVMRSEESYSENWLYVAENPVRKHLAARLEDWPYQGEIFPLEARGHV